MPNLLKPESWQREVYLRNGQTIYFTVGPRVLWIRVDHTYYDEHTKHLIINGHGPNGRVDVQTKHGQIFIESRMLNAVMVKHEDMAGDKRVQEIVQLKLEVYAKFYTSRRKAKHSKLLEFWEAMPRACRIVPKFKGTTLNAAYARKMKLLGISKDLFKSIKAGYAGTLPIGDGLRSMSPDMKIRFLPGDLTTFKAVEVPPPELLEHASNLADCPGCTYEQVRGRAQRTQMSEYSPEQIDADMQFRGPDYPSYTVVRTKHRVPASDGLRFATDFENLQITDSVNDKKDQE